jgi:ribosomal protein S18 acetylase RimI-like enzyme
MRPEVIRELRVDDLPLVVEMVRDSFDSRRLPFMVYSQLGIVKFLSVPLQYPESSPDRYPVVLTDEEGVQGYADFRILDERVGFLSYICVKPQARGRGVATRLIDSFLSRFPELNELQLDVFNDNAPARRMYEKLGFKRKWSSSWITRSLPEPHGSCEIPALATSLAAFALYGFCELEVLVDQGNVKVGLLGEALFKSPSVEAFDNDALWAALREVFPPAKCAFAVVRETDLSAVKVAYVVVNVTDRMTLERR